MVILTLMILLQRCTLTVVCAVFVLLTQASFADVLVDDAWADGSRNDTSLPDEAAWFGSSTTTLTATTGSMSGAVAAGNSALWVSYFTGTNAAPISLNIGDALTVSLSFRLTGLAPPNGSQGFRLAVVNTHDSAAISPPGTLRATNDAKLADGSSWGTGSLGLGVQGLALFLNMGSTFSSGTPLELRKRTSLSETSLLGSSGAWTALVRNGGTNGFPGFVENTPIRVIVELKRTAAASLLFTATISNEMSGAVIATNWTDLGATNFGFDTVAIRPSSGATTAANFSFTRFKVELLAALPVAPAITGEPQNRDLHAGDDAVLSVNASGTAPLAFQWYFNTNSPIAGATTNTLTITNVQPPDAGRYLVVVTNGAGSATSEVARLTVDTNPVPPSIIRQPQHLTSASGLAGSFTVVASGTKPLDFQWFRSPQTRLSNATNATLTLSILTTNDAGGYFVVITNSGGSVTSEVATLIITAPLTDAPEFSLVGFAAVDGFASNGTLRAGGTTGGAGGVHVQVSTAADLVKYLQTNTTLLVEIMNDIDLASLANHSGGFPADYPTGEILVRSDKTVYSKNGAAIRRGTLRIGKPSLGPQQNIIIRNLRFRDLWVPDPSGNYDTYGWDYVHVEEGCHHIWVDHCDFEQVYDGMIDVTHASDLITVSWNVFRNQKKCSLIGHSDSNEAEDTGHLNVTYHHNWFVDVEERMPRVRFGNAHVFNLYCENLGGKAIQSTCGAGTLVENSFFLHPKSGTSPTIEANGGPTGTVKVVNSVIENLPANNVQFRQYGQAGFQFNPPFAGPAVPYPYALDPVTNVAGMVTNFAGVGKVGYELWQMEMFSLTQLTNAEVSGRYVDPDGDGFNNYQEYVAGTNPTNQLSLLRMLSAVRQGDDVVVSWKAGAGRTNQVQGTTGGNPFFGVGDFVDLGGPIAIPGIGDVVTNYVHIGVATNSPERFYRVLALP